MKQKAEKCNSLARRIIELETENIDFTSVQVKLREKVQTYKVFSLYNFILKCLTDDH